MFCSGIDLSLLQEVAGNPEDRDPGRQALFMDREIRAMQEGCTALSNCSKPVIAVAQKVCIGEPSASADVASDSHCTLQYISDRYW